MNSNVKYPEHEKMRAVHDEAQRLGRFLEWLESDGREIAEYRPSGNNGKPLFVWKEDRGPGGTRAVCRHRGGHLRYPQAMCGVEARRHTDAMTSPLGYSPHAFVAPPEHPDKIDYANGYAVDNPDYDSWDEGLYSWRPPGTGGRIERILALYFSIDLDAISREKDAMLNELRQRANGTEDKR